MGNVVAGSLHPDPQTAGREEGRGKEGNRRRRENVPGPGVGF